MSEKAAIQATYADYRRVKGRKVFQLILEVPIEYAPEVHKYLGEPAFSDKEILVAVAKLNPAAVAGGSAETDPHRPCAPVTHRLSQQAALYCQEELFWRFIENEYDPAMQINSKEDAAQYLRCICMVESRSEFDTDKMAAARWKKIYSQYHFWKRCENVA